jgi:DNA gyrase/topoisomerase IV subunit B
MKISMFWDDNTDIESFIFSWQTSGNRFLGCNTYGTFLVKGKLLNVQETSHREIMEKDEININHILGL